MLVEDRGAGPAIQGSSGRIWGALRVGLVLYRALPPRPGYPVLARLILRSPPRLPAPAARSRTLTSVPLPSELLSTFFSRAGILRDRLPTSFWSLSKRGRRREPERAATGWVG